MEQSVFWNTDEIHELHIYENKYNTIRAHVHKCCDTDLYFHSFQVCRIKMCNPKTTFS